MRGGVFRSVNILFVLVALVGIAAALVSTIYFTEESLPWKSFLTGILVASVLAEAARASRSEWLLMRRTSQVSSLKEKFEFEVELRKSTDEKLAEAQVRLRLLDETLLLMIVLIDTSGHCQYHNRAFREWLNLKAERIDGRHIRELLGSRAYSGIATGIQQSLDGQSLRYEHMQEMSGGHLYRLSVEHVPQFDANGRVYGFYFLAVDMTHRDDLALSAKLESAASARTQFVAGADQELFVTSFSDAVSGRHDAGTHLIASMQAGNFRLYCQLISPLPLYSGRTVHYEILIRLNEEEGGMMPPGAFFPLAEKNGLMPYLDRWVVGHVLEWASKQSGVGEGIESVFFINVAAATMGDPEFHDYLQDVLEKYGIPASMLCFEVAESELAAHNSSVTSFITQVRQCGCRVALSGFGKNGVAFDQIRGFQVEFLKIDGGTILNMLGNPVNLAKVVSIDRVAKKIGVKTIAELVESDEVVAKLTEIGVDFAQGFGISRPRELGE